VTIVIRDDVQWVFPRHSWLGQPMRLCGHSSLWQPMWLRNASARMLFSMRFGSTLDRFGIRPQHGPFDGKIIASDEFYTYLEHGIIRLERASSFDVGPDGRTIHFSSGAKEEVDIIITCTGFEPPGVKSLPFLAKYLDPQIGLNGLYKSIFHPDIPNCAFVGYAYGFVAIPIVADLQARGAAQALSGKITLPSAEEQKADVGRVVSNNGWGTTLWLTDNAAFSEVKALATGSSGSGGWLSSLATYAVPVGVGLAATAAMAVAAGRFRH